MKAFLRGNGGYAVPVAMMVMVVMIGFAMATLAYVDAETNSSRRERTHEARLNLTEGVVAAQIFQLSRGWPTSAAKALPTDCTQVATNPLCPQPAQLKSQFTAVDFKLNPTWSVQVRDNDIAASTGQYYTDADVLSRPTWDANGDGEMWVRAEGVLEGKHRIIVARVRVEKRPLKPPKAPFVAGRFNSGNNGSNVIVKTDPDVYGIVRCDSGGYASATDNECISYVNGQISPVGMVRSDINTGGAIPDGMADALKQMAINNNTYYANSCPADPSGDVVWVENANCNYSSNLKVNATTKKGVFIINRGTLQISGSVEWWGLIYALNAQGCGPSSNSGCVSSAGGYHDGVVQITGTTTIHGGVFVEGDGRLTIGNSGNAGNCNACQPNLIYDPTVAFQITAHGTAGIIQNTWRELVPG